MLANTALPDRYAIIPNEPAAIITGTMARPSSPSVRLTALPAPTITKAAKIGKNRPRLMRKSLKNGIVTIDSSAGVSSHMKQADAMIAITASASRRIRPEKPPCVARRTLR